MWGRGWSAACPANRKAPPKRAGQSAGRGRGPEKGEAMEKCEKKGKREEPLCAWD